MTEEVVVALGLVLVFEGLLYALVPRQLKAMLVSLLQLSDDQLRLGGVLAVAFGVTLVWLAHGVLTTS
jgi:hypothetical protein